MRGWLFQKWFQPNIQTKKKQKKIVTESLKNSMEKFGDPVDYENIYGEEPENSDIKKVYDELNLNK